MTREVNGMPVIARSLWNVLRPQGDPVDDLAVSVRHGDVDVEGDEGRAQVTVSLRDDGVDIRAHDLQVFVKGTHVAVVQAHPPYPIERWSILWEGDLVSVR